MLKGTLKFLKNSFYGKEQTKIASGLYHYRYHDLTGNSRIHLRVNEDGSGVLIVNANRVMHLNRTATYMAYQYMNGSPTEDVIKSLVGSYKIDHTTAVHDYAQFADTLKELMSPLGSCPIHELEIDITTPFSEMPSSPYRMDLALTYRCNNDCLHCYNARERTHPELPTDEWKKIIDRVWKYGIPHIVFTGGEPTLRNDLPDLIAHAEANGQITGLNTNGRRLKDKRYLNQLVKAGLDHVQITIESHLPAIHDGMVNTRGSWSQTVTGIDNVLDTPLFVMTNTTMLRDNSPHLAGTLDFLGSMGVPTIGLNALIYSGRGRNVGTGLNESELAPLLEIARTYTDKYNQRLIWYTPTQYCHFDPMQLELGVKGCTAALYNMCIESDGTVIPCQSYYEPLGNILNDSWNSIWNHDLSKRLRERRYVEGKCEDCILLGECGGGCPLMNKIVDSQ